MLAGQQAGIGPNRTFLRYIGRALPSLGETGAVLSTVAGLYPGVIAGRAETPATVAVKGRPAMVGVIAAAVRDRQRVPDDVVQIVIDGETLRLDRRTCLRAEAAELLGEDDRAAEARARRRRRVRIAEEQGVLDILAGSAAHEPRRPG